MRPLKALGLLIASTLGTATAAEEPSRQQGATLQVAAYRSFVGKYGPGGDLKKDFEKNCSCKLEWVTSSDAGALLSDLRFGRFKTVDVVLGFDNAQVEDMKKTKKLKSTTTKVGRSGLLSSADHTFQALDFGLFAVIVDTQKVKTFPKTLQEFLRDPQFRKSFAAQDPRTSSPGFGLLRWIRQVAKNDAEWKELLKMLKNQVISFSPGWSQSYGLLTKGEAKAVFSYTTSELYHKLSESSDRYKALPFSNGHPLQVEYAAALKAAPSPKLAQDFLKFLSTPEAQKTIALKNWMYPVLEEALPLLPPAFQTSLKSFRVMKPPKLSAKGRSSFQRRALIQQWRQAFR